MTCVQNEHRLWKRLVKKGMNERTHIVREEKASVNFQRFKSPEITDNRAAIRQAMKENPMRKTVRIRSKMP